MKIESLPIVALLGSLLCIGPANAETSTKVGFKKGFFIKSDDGNFKLKIGSRVQSRLMYETVDGEEETIQDDKANFSVPRARITFSGHIWNKDLTFKFQPDFGKGSLNLKDFYTDYRFAGDVRIRVGQMKKPFSRQQLNSSSRLELVDRATTDKAFGAGRDIGFLFHNNYTKSPKFEWAVGLYNGTGYKPWFSGSADTETGSISQGKFTNVPTQFGPLVAMRLGYNYGKIKGYSEGDHKGGDLRFALAASSLVNLDIHENNGRKLDTEVDFILKMHGFSTTGAYYLSMAEAEEDKDTLETGLQGYHLQMSYQISDKVVPVLRYAHFKDDSPNSATKEYLFGLASYFYGHQVKWQTDFGSEIKDIAGEEPVDFRIRTQLQVTF